MWKKALYSYERQFSKEKNQSIIKYIPYFKSLNNNMTDEFFEKSLQSIFKLNTDQLIHLSDIPYSKGNNDWRSLYQKLIKGKYKNHEIPLSSVKNNNEAVMSFFNFYKPFLQIALGILEEKNTSQYLNQTLIKSILEQLSSSLFVLSYRTLILELHVASISNQLIGETPEERFQYYTDILLSDPTFLRDFYNEYTVLVRISLSNTLNLCSHVSELFHRLNEDAQLLSKKFNNGSDIGNLIEINLSLGDSHKKGRSVTLLKFDSSLNIVYKPRSLKVDKQFQNLLRWINEQGPQKENHRIVKVEDRINYGWVEYIEQMDCNSKSDVKRFYNRIGSYLALLYVLNSVDFHHENIIAHGEYPILVDLESIFHQDHYTLEYTKSAVSQATKIVQRSVKSTHILPFLLYYDSNSKGVDISGLGGGDTQTFPFKTNNIINKNTDNMKISKDYPLIQPQKNQPKIQNKVVNITDYLEDIESGFKTMYKWLLSNRNAFQDQLQHFENIEVRCILRNSAYYSELLQNSYHPDFLRDGIFRDFSFLRLGLTSNELENLMMVSHSEKKDMLNGDMPYFTFLSNKRHLWDSEGNCFQNFFDQTVLDIIYDKLNSLSEEDYQKQLQIIRMSMLASNNARHDAEVASVIPKLEEKEPLNKKTFLGEAILIGEYLLANAIKGVNLDNEEEFSWISTVIEGKNELTWSISPIGVDLYNGNSGIALFFGYLAELTNRKDFKDASIKSLRPVKDALLTLKESAITEKTLIPIGAYSGVSGYFYSLFQLGTLWDDSSLLKEVLSSLFIFEKLIPNDNTFDIIAGASSAIPVLLGIYEKTKYLPALEYAKQCAYHLINNSEKYEKSIAWRQEGDSNAYTGFAHGTSGIAAMLGQVYSYAPCDQLKNAIINALYYERRYFDSDLKNWHSPGRDSDSVAWCHGAPGVLLSRLLLKKVGIEDEYFKKEIETALQTTLEFGFGNNRSLCHGDFGNIEIFRLASQILNEEKWLNFADSASNQVLQVIKERNWKNGVSRGVESVGLMTGLSGYGYGLLKQFSPSRVPSILYLES